VYITWVAREVKDPQRKPAALRSSLGLALVGVVYLAINAVYLYGTAMTALPRRTSVAQAAAVSMFSGGVARWLALMISISSSAR